MPSVFEYFNLAQDNSTPVPQLASNTTFFQLQKEASDYFSVKENAAAADGNVLAVSIVEGQSFTLQNEKHAKFLTRCTELFKEKSDALKLLDKKIAGSVSLGVLATSLSFIPLVGYFSALGWGGSVYFVNQRGKAYSEYMESLNLLVCACNWSLGQGKDERLNNENDLCTAPTIRKMMTELYSVLTEKQARHLIADDIEGVFAKELVDFESKFSLSFSKNTLFANKSADEYIALSKKGAGFTRCVYGFNKGRPIDFLDAFISIIPDLYRAIVDGFKQLIHKLKGENQAEAVLSAAALAV